MTELKIKSSNETTIAYYADRIRDHLQTANVAWKQIGEVFAAAADEYGFQSDRMKSLMKTTQFSKSKVSKLINIHNSSRLRKYQNLFGSTEAWTTLYEITSLTDEAFERLVRDVIEGQVVTMGDVNKAKTKVQKLIDSYRTVFSVQIDINAIKSQNFDGGDYTALMDAIQTIQDTMNFVRVVETNVFENDAARFHTEIEREVNKLARQLWNDEKKKFVKNRQIDPVTKDELKNEIAELVRQGEFQTAFEFIGSDRFDEANLYQQAIDNVYQRREKRYAGLVKRSDEYANTAVQTLKSAA